ncbi:hypothetical protein ALC56_05206 [Trachymyrmex septentrionalis]|uniref:Uncharacterized protein n=1 Tax=Trachymyrmex septentrionalis TaxID=34720 RepID=A0A195FIR5_9HYME|nr:hypothetical protein ALC56_05206 [Trachymyrmex septentrionalis]
MRDLLHALSRMQADRDTEAYRLGTSAVSTLLKLQGVKDSRAARKLDDELDCDLRCSFAFNSFACGTNESFSKSCICHSHAHTYHRYV